MMTDTPHLLFYTAPGSSIPFDLSAIAAVGYELNSFTQQQEIEAWLRANRVTAILIAVFPNATEGLQYSEEILKYYPTIPIILVTSVINQSSLKKSLEIGLIDYLTTPVDLPVLVATIEHARERQESQHIDSSFEIVFSGLSDGFILLDLNSCILYVNQSARQIFNITEEHVKGKSANEIIFHPDFLDITKPQRTFPYRNEISIENGHTYSAQASLIPGIGIAVILQDVTHLKELNRIKTDFVNTISHDLRSPLTSIYGFVGLIDRVGPVNRQQAEFIRHIQSSVQNITALINDLMDLNRVESGYDLQMVDVRIKEILSQAINNLEYQSSEKMQDIVLSVPDDIPVIIGNPLHLQRMASNLIENAIKFTPPMGKIEIRCRVEADQLILQFADNGPGIPLEDQPHIFDKFYRGSNLAQITSGTGLGLSIVKSIVENHHGRIWVDSSPAGTTFSIILPL